MGRVANKADVVPAHAQNDSVLLKMTKEQRRAALAHPLHPTKPLVASLQHYPALFVPSRCRYAEDPTAARHCLKVFISTLPLAAAAA